MHINFLSSFRALTPANEKINDPFAKGEVLLKGKASGALFVHWSGFANCKATCCVMRSRHYSPDRLLSFDRTDNNLGSPSSVLSSGQPFRDVVESYLEAFISILFCRDYVDALIEITIP